jgi:outer membrane protein TolC
VEEVAEWQEILKLSESNLKRLRIQYNNRTASLLDLQKGEEAHLNSKLRLLEATARQENTLNDLKKLMGQTINQRIQLDPGIEEQQFRRATGLSVKEMLVRNPSLKTLEKKIGMIKEKINFSRLGKWPTPFAQGGYQTKPDPRQSTFEISEERDQWYVTLGLQWKLFDWKKTKRETQQLILDLEKEKILSSQLKTDLEAKWLDLKAKEEHHLKTRGLLEQRLSMLEKQLKLSQNLFDVGKVDLTELTEVDERLKLTHLELKENHYMFLLNSLEMVYLTGESLFPPNILNQYRKHITDDPISPS